VAQEFTTRRPVVSAFCTKCTKIITVSMLASFGTRDLFSQDRDETRDVNMLDRDETETLGTVSETRPRRDIVSPRLRLRRYKLPRRLVKSSKQSPQVAAYRDN